LVENLILAVIAFIGLTLALGKKAYEEDIANNVEKEL